MSGPAASLDRQRLLKRLSTLTDEADRRKFLSRNQSLLRAEIVTELANEVREQVRVNLQAALNLAEAAFAIANVLNDKDSLARSLRAKANVASAQGQNSAAIDLYEQAVTLFDATGNSDEVARTLSGSLQPLRLLGEYDRAFAAGDRARKIFAARGNVWRLARLEINVGNIFYRQDRFAEALACYQRAYDGLSTQQDPEGMAAVLSNLITCYISLNAFPEAMEAYKRARRFCEEHAMPLLVSQADYNAAYLYYLRGEYSTAVEMLRAARLNSQKIGNAYRSALCDLDMAEIYLELNLNSEAEELAQQGYASFCKLKMGYESAKCRAFSAIAASRKGQASKALKLFSESREIFAREKNQIWPALIDLYRALLFFNEGRLSEARQLCAGALESFPSLNLWNKAVLAQLLLARIALAAGDPGEAFRHVNAALEKLSGLEAPDLAHQAHFLLGNIYSAMGERSQAHTAYQTARQSLETLRSSLRSEELKIAFIKNRLEVYEKLVDLCMERTGQDAAEEAFGYIEEAKSRILMDLFIRSAPKPSQAEPAENNVVRSLRESREELDWYYNRIEREQLRSGEYSPERIAKLQQEARNREKELSRSLQEATESEAVQAGLQTQSHVPLATVRSTLPPNTMLVEYFLIQERLVVCLVGQQTLELMPVTLEPRVAGILRLFQFQLSKFRLDPQYQQAFHDSFFRAAQAHLGELYKELIAPIVYRLKASHLIFVPHGLLHYVPFHALFDGEQYLIDRYTVSYAPSAGIFALGQTRSSDSHGGSLVLGIPDTKAPAILEEVQALAGILDQADVYVGKEAGEKVLRSKGPGSRVVHIATHGRFRQDNAMFSGIWLGDSFLTLYDLYHLKLPVDLVTLSGCSTGLNVIAAGDELIGLVRGLLQAGARSLVLSLWDIHDKSTARFMEIFYRLLQHGESKPNAIKAAMIELRSSYPHPYQWAPFVLVGKI